MEDSRSSPKRIEGPDGRNLQLHFSTGQLVISRPEVSVKLDVVVVEGDFNNEDEEGWTQEEFESHVVKEREGKRPLLHGDLQLTLKDGDLIFTDNSSWIRSRKFRLGLKVASGFCEGIHIREAKTEAFTVKDHRGELYKKHYPPALNDEVWRLDKIGKDESFHKTLTRAGILTVEDFITYYNAILYLYQKIIKKYNLREKGHSQYQSYALGIKEVWEIDESKHHPGFVLHTLGWPLDQKRYGGSFMYHMNDRQVSIGLVVALNYRNPF
ncbi:calmodulin-binding protein 60 D-like [Humulus lupulus]|uniref:calmodulin-binding protein 60 D-like n=1 Tax=Humulus lupulus TaxID=3486 RepID=UPI002B4009AB|nr:calmodulin-binding protein 60 D-like [Humulus lupulus]